MKTINLLPKEERVRDVKSIMLGAVMVILIILLIAAAGFSFIIYNVNRGLTPELENYERVNMQLNNYINKLQAYTSFKEEVNKKAKVIEYLKAREILWSDILYDFGENMPENAYIDYMEGDSERFYSLISSLEEGEVEEINKVLLFTISGNALDYKDVTRLLVYLRNMENIGEVWINNISKDYVTSSNLDVLSFNISAYLDIGPYIEELGLDEVEKEETGDEEILDQELEMLNQ